MAYTDIDKSTEYFNTKLYTGTEVSGNSITGIGFQPDWIWIKNRTDATNHNLYDSVRGGNGTSHYFLKSNVTNVEGTNTSSLLTIDSDGFTLGDGNEVNGSGDNMVSWNWLAGGTASSNTDGSITSNVSANTTSGFSIVSYTGNSTSGATVGHGLGVEPSFFVCKGRDIAKGWLCYHKSLGATKGIILDETTDAGTTSIYFNNTAPTSSVFSMGNDDKLNQSGNSYIAYCFAEKKGFSKFGSYTGNGSTDGPFIYTGFKPAFVIIKCTSTITNWLMRDNKRDPFNESTTPLAPNVTAGESSFSTSLNEVDILSNGFKLRDSYVDQNQSGATYIYMAFAENPFVTSTGIPACAR